MFGVETSSRIDKFPQRFITDYYVLAPYEQGEFTGESVAIAQKQVPIELQRRAGDIICGASHATSLIPESSCQRSSSQILADFVADCPRSINKIKFRFPHELRDLKLPSKFWQADPGDRRAREIRDVAGRL